MIIQHSYTIKKTITPQLVVRYRAECSCGHKGFWTTTTNSARDIGAVHYVRYHR